MFAGLQSSSRFFGSSGWTFCVAVNLNPSPHKAKPEKILSLSVKRIKPTLICQTSTVELKRNSRILFTFPVQVVIYLLRRWREAVAKFSLHFPDCFHGGSQFKKNERKMARERLEITELANQNARFWNAALWLEEQKFVPDGLSSPDFETVILWVVVWAAAINNSNNYFLILHFF